MNHDRLRLDLADLADEVTPVDLRDRALRTSRRLGIQRAVATSAAALVLVAAATGTAFAIRPDAQAPTPAPAAPSVAVSEPPVEVTSTPEPTAVPSTTAVDVTKPAPAERIGRVFYGPAPGNSAATTAQLQSWTPGGASVELLSIPRTSALTNATVSPDGERVAWVDREAVLWVADVDGSGRRKLHEGVDGTCWGPTWFPDGSTLSAALVDPADPGKSRRGNLDVRTGTFTDLGLTEEGCHPIWSGDGRYLAFPDGSTGRVLVSNDAGAVIRSVPHLGGDARFHCFDVASLSPDGSRIALFRRGRGQESGDVGRELDVDAVLDTRTGEEFDLPLDGRKLLQAYFQSDGTLVVRAGSVDGNVLVLIGADGRKISEETEPAAFRDMQILHVAG